MEQQFEGGQPVAGGGETQQAGQPYDEVPVTAQEELAEQQLHANEVEQVRAVYPELQQEEAVEALTERALQVALEIGRPELAGDLDFLEMVHVSSGSAAAHKHQRDAVDAIVGTGQGGRNALPF